MSNAFISKGLRNEIPSDAILLTKQEALDIHWKTIKEWKPHTDTWPFRYGIGALAGINAVSTVNIAHHYRKRLKLGNYGRTTMLLPSIVLPCIVTIASHMTVITNSIFLGEDCPLCLQTKAAVIQVAGGVIYPVIATPIVGCYYAMTYGTYDVPPIRREYLSELFRLWLSMTRKLRMRLPIAMAVNGFAASILTYFEAMSFYSIQSVIHEREQEFRNTFSTNSKSRV